MTEPVKQDANLTDGRPARVAQAVVLVLADVGPDETLTPMPSGAAEEHKGEA